MSLRRRNNVINLPPHIRALRRPAQKQRVFAWRWEARKQAASVQQEFPDFVPAMATAPPPESAPKRPAQPRKRKTTRDAGVIELEIDGIAMRVGDPCAEGNVVNGPTSAIKVMAATKPVDFRNGMEGLAALVRETMGADPFSGAVDVLRAKRQIGSS